MRYLTDTEIINWNNRLENNSAYRVYPQYSHKYSWPSLVFKLATTNYPGVILTETIDPFMTFKYSFSVASNRVDFFWSLFDKWYTGKIDNRTMYSEKESDIVVTDQIISSKSEIKHKILDKEYVLYDYEFKGKLSSIIAYVMFLDDTIDIFSEIYGYDGDGKEHYLLKYPIGSVVSKIDDKSKEYLISDITPIKMDGKFKIAYQISEMMIQGSIVKYGSSELINESKLCFSRNNRIDDILN